MSPAQRRGEGLDPLPRWMAGGSDGDLPDVDSVPMPMKYQWRYSEGDLPVGTDVLQELLQSGFWGSY